MEGNISVRLEGDRKPGDPTAIWLKSSQTTQLTICQDFNWFSLFVSIPEPQLKKRAILLSGMSSLICTNLGCRFHHLVVERALLNLKERHLRYQHRTTTPGRDHHRHGDEVLEEEGSHRVLGQGHHFLAIVQMTIRGRIMIQGQGQAIAGIKSGPRHNNHQNHCLRNQMMRKKCQPNPQMKEKCGTEDRLMRSTSARQPGGRCLM